MSEQMQMPVYGRGAESIGLGSATKHMLRVGRRHARLFFVCFLAILAVGFIILWSLTPRYTATATVAITQQSVDPLAPLGTQSADQFEDDDLPATIAATMQSREVATAVLNQLPPASRDAGAHGLFCRLHLPLLCRHPVYADVATQQENQMEQFLKSLTVMPEAHSQIIDVSVSALSPARAAMLANALVQNYQRLSLAQRSMDSSNVANWLETRTNALRQSWLAAVQAADAYSVAHHLTTTSNGATTALLVDRQIDVVANQLETAQSELAAAQAEADAPHHNGAVETPLAPAMTQASGTLLQLQSERDELATEFGPNYPRLRALNREISALNARMPGSSGGIAPSVQINLTLAQARVHELNKRLDLLEAEASEQSEPEAEYLSLTAEANSAQIAYESFLQHADDDSNRTSLLQPPVNVVSRAGIPLRPTFPDTTKVGLGIVLLALAASAGATLARDYLTRGISEVEDLSGSAQLPLLASFPFIHVQPGFMVNRHVLDEPFSRTSEAVRSVASRLSLLAVDQIGARTVLLTSAGAHEGKSTLAIWLATTVSQTGHKVLLIDGDHRRGTLMQDELAPPKLGLADLLAGRISQKNAINKDPETNIDYIAAGVAMPRSFGTRDINRLRKLLTSLKRSYSLIIIDSPPLLAMVDGLVLASVVDQTVFLCRWQHTSRQAVAVSLDRLRTYGAHVCGIVVSMVDQTANLSFEGEYSRRELKLINRLYGS